MHLTARTIWGKVVLFLKEQKQIALHVACGDITDVVLQGDVLHVNLQDGMLLSLLQDGVKEIERALRWQGLDVKVQFNIKEKYQSKADKDIEKLRKIFGENLKIKGE